MNFQMLSEEDIQKILSEKTLDDSQYEKLKNLLMMKGSDEKWRTEMWSILLNVDKLK
jgi:uncharacterized membrane protein